MIKNSQTLSMAEALDYVKGKENSEVETKGFIKKFTKFDAKTGRSIREKIKALDLMKVRAEHISKIIDLMPDSEEELNKIFADIGLDEDETKKILETIKEFK